MDRLSAHELALELNQTINKAKRFRGDMDAELARYIVEIVNRLSFGIHTQKDIEEAKMFMESFDKFFLMNKETIERLQDETSSVGTPGTGHSPSTTS